MEIFEVVLANIRMKLAVLPVTLFAVAALGKKRASQSPQLMRTFSMSMDSVGSSLCCEHL